MSTTKDTNAVQPCPVGGTGIWFVQQGGAPAAAEGATPGERRAVAEAAWRLPAERKAVAQRCAERVASRARPPCGGRAARAVACRDVARADADAVASCIRAHPWAFVDPAGGEGGAPASSSTALCVGQLQLSSSARPLTVTYVGSSPVGGPGLTDLVLTQCSWDVSGLRCA